MDGCAQVESAAVRPQQVKLGRLQLKYISVSHPELEFGLRPRDIILDLQLRMFESQYFLKAGRGMMQRISEPGFGFFVLGLQLLKWTMGRHSPCPAGTPTEQVQSQCGIESRSRQTNYG